MLPYAGAYVLLTHAQLFILNKPKIFYSAVFYTCFFYAVPSGEFDPALSVFLEVGVSAKVLTSA